MGVRMGGCIHTESIDQSPLCPHARFSLQQCSHCSQTVLLQVRCTHRHTVHRPHTSTHLSLTSPNPIKLGPHRCRLLSHPLTPHSHTPNLNFPLPTSHFPPPLNMHHFSTIRSLLVSALLAFVACTAAFGATFTCSPTDVKINTDFDKPRLIIVCSNAQSDSGDTVTNFTFLLDSPENRAYGKMMAQLASVTHVNNGDIFINYSSGRSAANCVVQSICRKINNIGI